MRNINYSSVFLSFENKLINDILLLPTKIPSRKLSILITFLVLSTLSFSKTRFIRVIFNDDASTKASIIWDQVEGEFEGLYLDTIDPSINRFAHRYKLSSSNNMRGMNNKIIRLKDLIPNKTYYFILKDNTGLSQLYYFRTAPNRPEIPLTFIAGGDSRDNRPVRVKANKLVPKLYVTAVLFNGDFIGFDTKKDWIEWFLDWENTIARDGRITPMLVTRGNHELSNKVIYQLFDLPNRKLFYSTTFGGDLLHIVSLNSEILKIGRQKLFLRSALAKHKDYTWQIAQYHRPIRAHVKAKKEMETQYKNFVPLFEKYKNLPLCLENDSHTCKVTWPIVSSKSPESSEGFIRDDKNGIVYAGEGCWGAPLRAADDLKPWTRDAGSVNQFNWIFVSKEKIELRTVLYENEAEIISLNYQNRLTIPEGLKLFGPNNGTLIEIFPRK